LSYGLLHHVARADQSIWQKNLFGRIARQSECRVTGVSQQRQVRSLSSLFYISTRICFIFFKNNFSSPALDPALDAALADMVSGVGSTASVREAVARPLSASDRVSFSACVAVARVEQLGHHTLLILLFRSDSG
jgi:hypothetical protein